jgi:hypothetical protein
MPKNTSRPHELDEPPLKPIIEPPGYVPPSLEGLERLAWLMDRAFKIPGTPVRVGLDAILGLIPVGGDLLTGLVQAGIVLMAVGVYKVPRAVAARMAANVLLDTVVGSIPLVGDAFDVFFKANTRNIQLLAEVERQRSLKKPVATASSWLYIAGIAAVLFGLLALVLIGFITLVGWVWRHTGGA